VAVEVVPEDKKKPQGKSKFLGREHGATVTYPKNDQIGGGPDNSISQGLKDAIAKKKALEAAKLGGPGAQPLPDPGGWGGDPGGGGGGGGSPHPYGPGNPLSPDYQPTQQEEIDRINEEGGYDPYGGYDPFIASHNAWAGQSGLAPQIPSVHGGFNPAPLPGMSQAEQGGVPWQEAAAMTAGMNTPYSSVDIGAELTNPYGNQMPSGPGSQPSYYETSEQGNYFNSPYQPSYYETSEQGNYFNQAVPESLPYQPYPNAGIMPNNLMGEFTGQTANYFGGGW